MIPKTKDLRLVALALLGFSGIAEGQGTTVYHLSLHGEVEFSTFALTDHAIRDAGRSGVSAVIIDLDIDGDDVDQALEIASLIEQSPISVYGYVSGRAWNAGAIVALACDSIYLSPAATMGGHGEVALPDSIESDSSTISIGDLFSRLATARGVAGEVGRAMVDSTVVVPGIDSMGSLAKFDASTAVAVGLAEAELSAAEEVVEAVGLSDIHVEEVDEDWLSTTVVIENHNWSDINIFVRLSGGAQIRLGTVTSNGSREFTISGHMLLSASYIQVVAEVIGSDEYMATEVVQVEPGLVIEWNLENVLRNSTYFIWVR